MVKQSTVNLVIIAAAIVVAAGAWGAPLLTVQTTHSIITSELASTESSIKNHTTSETGGTETILNSQLLGGYGNEQMGDCSMMELVMATSLGQSINDICDTGAMLGFIESGNSFDAKNFEFENEFVETLPAVLFPNEDCATGDLLTNAQIMNGTFVRSGASLGIFGAPACLQPLNGTSSPIGINLISINSTVIPQGESTTVRIQLAVITNNTAGLGDLCSTDAPAWFDNSTSLDTVVFIPANSSSTVSTFLNLPPTNAAHLCVRIADDDVAARDYTVWASGTEFFPLEVFQFVPPVSNISFNTFTKANFTETCAIALTIKADNGTALENVPVTLLQPNANNSTLPGIGFGSTVVKTNSTGQVVLGNGTDPSLVGNTALPSGFFVIDVNVPSTNSGETLTDFGSAFPDQVVQCSTKATTTGIVDLGSVTLNQFSGSGFDGTEIEIIVVNSNTNADIVGATVSGTFITPIGSGSLTSTITNALGEAIFSDVAPGKYTFSVTDVSGFTDVTNIVVDVFPGQDFVDRFVPMTLTPPS